MNVYRTGRHLGRTIYRNEMLIGIMDTPEDATLTVEALNARERGLAAPALPPSESLLLPSTCGRVGMHNCGITGRWHSHDSDWS